VLLWSLVIVLLLVLNATLCLWTIFRKQQVAYATQNLDRSIKHGMVVPRTQPLRHEDGLWDISIVILSEVRFIVPDFGADEGICISQLNRMLSRGGRSISHR